MPEDNAEFRRKLEQVHRTYLGRLPARLTEIEHGWSALAGQGDSGSLEPLHRAVHSLVGSAGTFGHDRLSEIARRIERFLKPLKESGRLPKPQEVERGEELLEELRQCLRSITGMLGANPGTADESADHETPTDAGLVYILSATDDLEMELAPQLRRFGYRVVRSSDLTQIRRALQEQPAAAIIAAISGSNKREHPARIAEGLGPNVLSSVPLLLVAPQDDLPLRIASVQAGAQMFYSRPVDIRALVSRLDVLTARHHREPYRVLLVDDEPELAEHYAAVLNQAGMHAEVATHWRELMPALARLRPEMIIMDIYMPGYSGLELATVVRQDERYLATPILFLSGETDESKQLSALGLGADGFLTKPVSDAQLINAVSARMQRSRLLSAAVSRDALTGLLNHTSIKELLATELARVQRYGGQLAFAMLDLDHFKRINDSRGHMAGDQVITRLARLLQRRMRRTDAVGRYGGEEFAVILTNAGLDDARGVIDAVREAFAGMQHGNEDGYFSATFSAGVASSAQHEHVEDLIEAADRALYNAKHAGRNQVLTAG